MPNHVINKVLFLGREENVNKALEAMGPTFDLNNIVKEPEGLDKELQALAVEAAKKFCSKHGPEDDVENYLVVTDPFGMYTARVDSFLDDFRTAVANYRRTGFCSWLEWRRKNWGCKWNTYEHRDQMNFFTANSPCREAYRKISEKFGITVKVLFADEDRGNNCGIITCKNGVMIEWNPEPGSEEAYQFSDNLWET